MEAVVRWISPRLEGLDIGLFEQLTFSMPGLLQFLNTIEVLSFESARFLFSDGTLSVEVHPREGPGILLFAHLCGVPAPRLVGIFRSASFQLA